jgi:hypothetical protein
VQYLVQLISSPPAAAATSPYLGIPAAAAVLLPPLLPPPLSLLLLQLLGHVRCLLPVAAIVSTVCKEPQGECTGGLGGPGHLHCIMTTLQ